MFNFLFKKQSQKAFSDGFEKAINISRVSIALKTLLTAKLLSLEQAQTITGLSFKLLNDIVNLNKSKDLFLINEEDIFKLIKLVDDKYNSYKNKENSNNDLYKNARRVIAEANKKEEVLFTDKDYTFIFNGKELIILFDNNSIKVDSLPIKFDTKPEKQITTIYKAISSDGSIALTFYVKETNIILKYLQINDNPQIDTEVNISINSPNYDKVKQYLNLTP